MASLNIMFADVDNSCQLSEFTFIVTVFVLGVPLIISHILLILQHIRFRRFKQLTG